MAKDQGSAPVKVPVLHNAQKETAVGPSNCKFDSCKKKPEKFGFCMEHYELYMGGVVRGDGKKPLDYEEKLAHFSRQHAKKVA